MSMAVEHVSEFPGGMEAFARYLSSNIRYPVEARQKNIQGKVFATFIVEKDGSITGIKILRGIGAGADEEALRLLSIMPKWHPGLQNGHAIREQYTVPISFTLTDADDKPVRGNYSYKPAADPQSEIFTSVENPAGFPGGIEAFYRYLSENISYPLEARQKNIQGKVFVTFIVERDGSLTDIKVLRGIGSGADEEAIRILKASPKWIPGIQNGQIIRQQFTVPISFILSDAKVSTGSN